MSLLGWAKRLSSGRTPGLTGTDRAGSFDTGGEPPSQRSTSEFDPVRRGIAALEAGDFAAACDAFREALARDPKSAANHVNLAYALQQSGAEADALPHLRAAASLDADSFDAHYMLGGAFERAGDLSGAIEHLERAIALRPDFEIAHADLCRVLVTRGDTRAGRRAIAAAIALNPTNADFHFCLGNLCMTEGNAPAAVESYERALALRPEFCQALINRGLALHKQQRFDMAAASFEQALAIDPLSGDAFRKLAATHKAQGRIDAATTALQRAVDVQPANADALNDLGIVQYEQGLLDQAIANYRRAIALRPDLPGGYANLGLALYDRGDVTEAVATYRQGLAIQPVAEMHDNLAIALQKLGAVDEAIEHFHKALALQPDNLNTRCNLAAALAYGGGPQEAIAAYRRILELRPDHLVAHSNLLFNLAVDDRCSPEEYLAEAERFDRKLATQPEVTFDHVSAEAGRRLRIGFVSGDLRSHPVGYFLEGMLHYLDASKFELFAYSTVAKEDELTARIKPRFTGWRVLKRQSDEAAAEMIRSDRIDILLDLAGHTADNRLPVFALRAAPVQVTWLGYFASTGVAAMDWVLADDICVPPGQDPLFTERVWRLPETRLCFTPPAEGTAPDVSSLPALQRGHVTFGCFQRLVKINDTVLDLWRQILEGLPSARLLLQSYQTGRPVYVEQILKRLAKVGIAPARVTVRGPAARQDYLQSYHEVDIVLDTFPYTGGTTTCEALWMGVPTLTLAGNTMIARQGVAMMRAAGLPEWVADTPGEYVRKAVAFGTDPAGLARLRSSMRRSIQSTPLFDIRLFAQRFEDAIRGIWHAHLAQLRSVSPS